MTLRLEALAKVNRSLLVLGVRPDGYHELDTLFQTIDLSDELVVEEDDRLTLSVAGAPLPSDDRNLVLVAARSLVARSGTTRGARFALTKRIPVGAGLGGGSADAAAALLGLNILWGLGLSAGELGQVAATVGSDVAFFLSGGRARGTGRGERIEMLPDLPDESLVLLVPPFGMATPDVYREVGAGALAGPPPTGPREDLMPDRNDLEAAAERLRPELRSLRASLLAAGAVTARLSGSGSALFGLFRSREVAEQAAAALGSLGGARAVVTRTVSRDEWRRRACPGGGCEAGSRKP
ncbi:MAG: 4-(cytidine 5'-diphospho)-2-C-methyl-D-erythritol kinase [Acidithiobacillales bacterium]